MSDVRTGTPRPKELSWPSVFVRFRACGLAVCAFGAEDSKGHRA